MPTLKQKLAAQKLLENTGISIGQAMREAGYAESTAVNPSELTTSKGFRELFDKVLPDKFLAKKHQELLSVPKKITHTRRGEVIETQEELDTHAIKAGLDMAYKVKGHYSAEKHDIGGEGLASLEALLRQSISSKEDE